MPSWELKEAKHLLRLAQCKAEEGKYLEAREALKTAADLTVGWHPRIRRQIEQILAFIQVAAEHQAQLWQHNAQTRAKKAGQLRKNITSKQQVWKP